MSDTVPAGTQKVISGRLRVFFNGYWVKAYETPADTLLAKKRLIEALTRRLFNHVEHGLNIPGSRLDEARAAYEAETDPARQRVKGAMLAGALFNRATDIFTKLVEIQAFGVKVDSDNALMRECGEHLQEALALATMVLHRSGEEGLDELWGEPFKAFCFPIEEFYRSRYIKIAMTMEAIAQIRDELVRVLAPMSAFAGVEALLVDFADAAQVKAETLRTDPEIFDVWTSFVVSREKLAAFRPAPVDHDGSAEGMRLLHTAQEIIAHITRARVPMPKTTAEFIERVRAFGAACVACAASEKAPACCSAAE